MSEAEKVLWRNLCNRRLGGFKFRRQHPVGGYFVDFTCIERGLVIELDGGQHAWQESEDRRRAHALRANGLEVVRFWNNEVLQHTDGVLATILRKLRGESAGQIGNQSHAGALPEGGEAETQWDTQGS